MRPYIVVGLALILVTIIALAITFGCRRSFKKKTDKTKNTVEGFADGSDAKDEKAIAKYKENLTTQERELFQDLKDNKLKDEQVKRLIDAGVLNSDLFEKFLNILGKEERSDADESKVEGFSMKR